MPGAGGLGIIFNTNKEGKGFIKRNQIGGSLSARIRMSDYWTSQLGLMVSYIQKQIDNDDFIWSDQLDNVHGLLYPRSSPTFDGFQNQNMSYVDLNLGYAAKYEKHYLSATLGVAVQHLTKPNESFSDLEQRLPRKYIFTSDFVILQRSNPKKGFKFNPGLLYEYFGGYHTFTLGSNVAKSVMYAGLWYRSKQSEIYNYQAVSVLVGLNIPMVNKYSRVKFMYSYDISVNNMKGNGGSHEITLRFEFDQIHLFKSSSAFADDYPIIYDPVIF
jgi:type IX secretion system PorP/SprF family membrane protein